MKVTYSEKARQWGEGYQLVQNATKRLEEVLGQSADQVTAEWDRTKDPRGGVLYTLKLRDATDQVQASFTPDELKFAVRFLLYRLWGDLLKIRSDEQHRKVQEMVDQLEGS